LNSEARVDDNHRLSARKALDRFAHEEQGEAFIIAFEWVTRRLLLAVRLEGANHQWRKIPSGELSIDLEADERLGRVPDITTL
jgi:hypothetical protein